MGKSSSKAIFVPTFNKASSQVGPILVETGQLNYCNPGSPSVLCCGGNHGGQKHVVLILVGIEFPTPAAQPRPSQRENCNHTTR